MCGIIAVCKDENETDLVKIIEGHDLLKNRGPDRGCLHIKTKHIYGFRRLSIVDTSINADQPFHSNGIIAMCNGEIYNHKELEKEYKLECNSGSDCECVLRLYEKIGFEKMIELLDGVFAIIIMDKNIVYTARDSIGVRPLYHAKTKSGNFAVASTAQALSQYCTEINQFYPGISKYYRDTKTLTTIPYISRIRNTYFNTDTRGVIHDLFIKAVKKRLMSERPIACMLSGGLDSSLVTSIICKFIGAENVRTYSIGMQGSEDLKYARIMADYLGTQHTEITFTPEEGYKAIPKVIRDIETYDVTTVRASVGMWLLSKYISENTEDIVIMSGEGSDEIFGGYLYFHHSPSPKEFEQETVNLVRNLYKYDVLRADRCISSHGLEPRVPFLDKELVDFVLKIPGELRQPISGYEKYILRSSFDNGEYLPSEILWRRKDGFSDGVSGGDKKWYENIQEMIVEEQCGGVSPNSLVEEEELYYKNIFSEHFPNYDLKVERWLPKWVEHNGDPSGRNVQV